MSSQIFEAQLREIQHGKSQIALIHTPHSSWPLRPKSGLNLTMTPSTLRVSVLDSSFNPPTRAHLALASLPHHSQSASSDSSSEYDARLLLLSVRNADKQLKLGDATHVQRMEMMLLLAHDIRDNNTAVAIVDEPTFVGKSTALIAFLHSHLLQLSLSPPASVISSIELSFVQGFDTLERLLSPRYYGSVEQMHQALRRFLSADEENSRVVCARRVMATNAAHVDAAKEEQALEPVRDLVLSNRIVLVDIDEDTQTLSSSEVREKISRGDESWHEMVTGSLAEYIVREKLYHASV